MSASGDYGQTRVCAGIVGHADLRLGARVRAGAGGAYARRRRPVPRHPPHHRIGRRPRDEPGLSPPPGPVWPTQFRAGFASLAPLGLSFDAWLYPPAARRAGRARARLPGDHHRPGPCRRAARRRRLCRQARRGFRAGGVDPRAGQVPQCVRQAGRHGHAPQASTSSTRPSRRRRKQLAAAWRPYVETCIEAFGAARCMFESNFPVDKGSVRLRAVLERVQNPSRGASATRRRICSAARRRGSTGWSCSRRRGRSGAAGRPGLRTSRSCGRSRGPRRCPACSRARSPARRPGWPAGTSIYTAHRR